MRSLLFVFTGALGLASLLAAMLGADGAGDAAEYAAFALVPAFWLIRRYANRRSLH